MNHETYKTLSEQIQTARKRFYEENKPGEAGEIMAGVTRNMLRARKALKVDSPQLSHDRINLLSREADSLLENMYRQGNRR